MTPAAREPEKVHCGYGIMSNELDPITCKHPIDHNVGHCEHSHDCLVNNLSKGYGIKHAGEICHTMQALTRKRDEHDTRRSSGQQKELDALTSLKIAQGILYEFCEWFCDYDCEEKPCTTTISRIHERLEGIEKQMREHPEYLAKWEEKRAEQRALLIAANTPLEEP